MVAYLLAVAALACLARAEHPATHPTSTNLTTETFNTTSSYGNIHLDVQVAEDQAKEIVPVFASERLELKRRTSRQRLTRSATDKTKRTPYETMTMEEAIIKSFRENPDLKIKPYYANNPIVGPELERVRAYVKAEIAKEEQAKADEAAEGKTELRLGKRESKVFSGERMGDQIQAWMMMTLSENMDCDPCLAEMYQSDPDMVGMVTRLKKVILENPDWMEEAVALGYL